MSRKPKTLTIPQRRRLLTKAAALADDVATTERALALENGPVLLVGHSYGGAVITEAGNNSKVAALVFVAAYAPDQGESALSASQFKVISSFQPSE